ncbi:hypothetical protein, partial [Legionella nautarum]
ISSSIGYEKILLLTSVIFRGDYQLTHILSGKTYMDVTFESLPLDDLHQFQKILKTELKSRRVQSHDHLPELTVPPFHLSVKIEDAIPRLDQKALLDVISKISDETLAGLSQQAHCALKKNQNLTDKSFKEFLRSSIYSNENRHSQLNTEGNSGFVFAKL